MICFSSYVTTEKLEKPKLSEMKSILITDKYRSEEKLVSVSSLEECINLGR